MVQYMWTPASISMIMCADDIVLYTSTNCPVAGYTNITEALAIVLRGCPANKFTVNVSKAKYIWS